MAVHMGNIAVKNNQLVISSFKPRVIDMHGREHLERFREAAEATGMGLDWPVWRWSVELGSKLFKELVAKNVLTNVDVKKIYTELGVTATVKKEDPDLEKLQALAAKMGFSLSKSVSPVSGVSTSSSTTTEATPSTTVVTSTSSSSTASTTTKKKKAVRIQRNQRKYCLCLLQSNFEKSCFDIVR